MEVSIVEQVRVIAHPQLLSPQNKRCIFNLFLSLKHRHATAGLRQRADRQQADRQQADQKME